MAEIKLKDITGKEHIFSSLSAANRWAERELKKIEKKIQALNNHITDLKHYKAHIKAELGLKIRGSKPTNIAEKAGSLTPEPAKELDKKH